MSGGAGEVLAWWRWVFVVMAGVAGVTPWVGFADGVSPWAVVWEYISHGGLVGIGSGEVFLMIASPFFVGVVIFVWKVRLGSWDQTRAWERAGAWLIGAASTGVTGYVVLCRILPEVWSHGRWNDSEGYCVLGSLAVMALGVATVIAFWWRRGRAELVALVPLYTAYVANAVICITAFSDARNVGWWLTGVACAGLVAELVVCVIGVGKRRSF